MHRTHKTENGEVRRSEYPPVAPQRGALCWEESSKAENGQCTFDCVNVFHESLRESFCQPYIKHAL
jgi:hypothetical protein